MASIRIRSSATALSRAARKGCSVRCARRVCSSRPPRDSVRRAASVLEVTMEMETVASPVIWS